MVGEGFFARWDGKDWKKADMTDVPRVYDLAVIGNDWGWAVGDHGALFQYDGAAWKKVDVPGSLFRLRAIAVRLPVGLLGRGGGRGCFRLGRHTVAKDPPGLARAADGGSRR